MLREMEFGMIVLLTVVFEVVTVLLRLGFKLQSKVWQKKYNVLRVHHGYIGMVFLVLSFFPPLHALWIVGWALIISDLVHHYTVLPLLRMAEVDISMAYYGLNTIGIQRKVVIALAAICVVATLASVATSLSVGLVALAMLIVSEELQELLPKFKCPQEVAVHF